MTDRRDEPYLLTPGPITTKRAVTEAMLRDLSPGSAEIVGATRRIRDYVVAIANGAGSHVCVPLQGSGTYAVEAMFHCLVPEDGKLLVIVNGYYGLRLAEMAAQMRIPHVILEKAVLPLPSGDEVAAALADDPAITHVVLCHCETGTGVLNRIEEIADATRAARVGLLVDCIATYAGIPLDLKRLDATAVTVSPNKCLESVPGLGLVVARQDALEAAEGRATSQALDLTAQWRHMETTGLWRYTPPTHVILALAAAVGIHEAEGGVPARHEKYRRNWRRLVDSMRQKGFHTLIPDTVASPIVTTFRDPDDPAYDFKPFHDLMVQRGFMIFPGRLTSAGTFRIGCMGDIDEATMTSIAEAVDESMDRLGVRNRAPAVR